MISGDQFQGYDFHYSKAMNAETVETEINEARGQLSLFKFKLSMNYMGMSSTLMILFLLPFWILKIPQKQELYLI